MGYTIYWKWKGDRAFTDRELELVQMNVERAYRNALASIKTDEGLSLTEVEINYHLGLEHLTNYDGTEHGLELFEKAPLFVESSLLSKTAFQLSHEN